MAVLLPLVMPVSGYATTNNADGAKSAILCRGYAACANAGMPHQGYATANGKMYWNMYSGTNCTNYVAYRMIRAGMPAARPAQLATGRGNAEYWGPSFGAATNQTPMVGAVAWWAAYSGGAGSAGHVAYVEQVVSANEIVISESNWGSEFTWRRIWKGRGHWPTGFIHLRDVSLGVAAAPVVTGSTQVGGVVTAHPGAWSPAATQYSFQWEADGVPIPGATGQHHDVYPAQLGKRLTVVVTAGRPWYGNGAARSAASAPVQPGVQQVTRAPSISGTAQVDQPLTADLGAYAPGAQGLAVQWLANGQPVPGANGASFVPTQAQIGARLSVVVTATRAGYTTVTATSPATEPVLAREIRVVQRGGITGQQLVGETLTASPGVLEPADSTVAYQWLRNGQPIPGANAATYVLQPQDIEARITVTMRLTRAGFRDTVVSYGPLDDVVAPVALTVTTANGTPRSALIKVAVAARGVGRADGKVWIKVAGRKYVAQVNRRGFVKVRVSGLKPGVRLVKVYYAGSDRTAKASGKTSVTVKAKATSGKNGR